MIKKLIKIFFPELWLLFYHKILAVLADWIYRFPSSRMIIIGVTGTNGKTTVCHMIRDILEQGGFRVGMTTSIDFQDGKRTWENNTKQGMPGRFRLRKLLSQMVENKCDYAIIETTSEGIKQFRHYRIDYDIAVFTNLTRDHIESHGSFKAYRQAKEELFKIVSTKEDGASIINLDDPNAEYFSQYQAKKIYGYGVHSERVQDDRVTDQITAENIKLYPEGSVFMVRDRLYSLALAGKHNIYNALAGLCVGLTQNVPPEVIQKALARFNGLPGRLEEIQNHQGFRIFVDYAHTEDALEKVYETLKAMPHQRIIAVLGATGGGRDKKKRPELGRLAARYCDLVFVTNEDPYDEDPQEIMNQVFAGVIAGGGKTENGNCWHILDRGEAIKEAIQKAKKGDIVIITGKGCEKVMAVKDGFVPWDDREEVRKILGRFTPLEKAADEVAGKI
ncbi:MAG: UDP-N-acetylmuramoyl-L-alanyl-D-glutamate--2,6-diaminopimelate ligase [Candidatus Doudnabacteria bacterium]